MTLAGDVTLRDVEETDLPTFFEYESDLPAVYMAAFTAKNPADRSAFDAHWKRILGDKTIVNRTILFDGHVAGSIASFIDQEFGKTNDLVAFLYPLDQRSRLLAGNVDETFGVQDAHPLY